MNSSLSLIIVAVWLVAAAGRTQGECCFRTYLQWAADNCGPFEKLYYMMKSNNEDDLSMLPTRCEANVCNDGRVHDGVYCGKGNCDMFGCNCDGGCIGGNPVENFRRINNIPNVDGGAWVDPKRSKRSNVLKKAENVAKIIQKGYKGYKEGKLSAESSRSDAERARKNAATVPPPATRSPVQKAVDKYKPRWGH